MHEMENKHIDKEKSLKMKEITKNLRKYYLNLFQSLTFTKCEYL